MPVFYSGITDRGDVRQENQDSILCLTGTPGGQSAALFVVADGMGGLSYGAAVSRYITEQFTDWWNQDLPQMIQAGLSTSRDVRELIEQQIWDVNQGILRFREEAQCRAGSTLSLLLLYRGNFYVANTGDSRIYRLRGEEWRQLTEDQSAVAQWVREGRMTEEEARRSKDKNKLTMCIGMFPEVKHLFYWGPVMDGDRFLLCSDGLYNALAPDQIEHVMRDLQQTSQEKVRTLRQLIRPGGAADNVSLIVTEFKEL